MEVQVENRVKKINKQINKENKRKKTHMQRIASLKN